MSRSILLVDDDRGFSSLAQAALAREGHAQEVIAPQWVIFRLEAAQYALPLERVVEVVRVVAIRPVAHGPAWLVGVIDRRGQALPIMDLRVRLGLPALPPRLDTRIIVADVGGAEGACFLGLLADEVLEVLAQTAVDIALPPALPGVDGPPLSTVQTADRLVPVFDLEHLGAEVQTLREIEAG